jgi:ABC-type sulfate/molybdate transport systems ATPase subunit
VAFARALLRRPSVLLLDEPFSALDATLRRDMGELLREIQRELGLPTVLVTHDAAEATALADTVILCDRGRIIRQGAPSEVFTRPTAAREARLEQVRNTDNLTTRGFRLVQQPTTISGP